MITPGYSITATERVLPRLALDFTTASLDSRVTITRALDTATRTNSSGFIETINANLPRFDFDPITKVCRGLLIEETRANLVLYSQQFNNDYWATRRVTKAADVAVGPDGASTADSFTETTDTNTHTLHSDDSGTQRFSVTSGVTYCLSLYLKKGTGSTAPDWFTLGFVEGFPTVTRVAFNISTGSVGSTANATGTITSVGNGWYRCVVIATANATTNLGRANFIFTNNTDTTTTPSYTGATTSNIFAWGAQVEAGAFPTSYIPTTTTSLTRNADDMAMTGTNFSSWFTTSAGALALKFISSATDTTGRFALLVPGVGASMRFRIGSDIRFQETNGTGVVFDMGISGISANTVYTVTGGWDINNFAACANAGNVATDTSGTPDATLNSLYVSGEVARGAFNGWVQAIRSWPFRITNAELRAFSK